MTFIRFTILLLLVLITGVGIAQDNTIIAYKGLSKDFDLSFYAENCDSIQFNGEHLKRSRSNNCKVTVAFEELGKKKLEFLKDNKLVESFQFNVKTLPDIKLVLGQQDGGEMTRQYFLIQPGPYVKYSADDFSQKITMHSFKIEIIRNKERIFKRLNMRGGYNTEIQNLLKRGVKAGDKIIYSDVMASIDGFNPFPVEGMTIKIKHE